MIREPVRTLVTVVCVGVGVAVVVAIDLAGEASAGSFRSSMETLQGSASYEIRQVGGVPDAVFGRLSRLRAPLDFSARVEGYGADPASGERYPLIGVDVVADRGLQNALPGSVPDLEQLVSSRLVWVSEPVGATPGDRIQLAVNETIQEFTVSSVLLDASTDGEPPGAVILMDIALAQQVLGKVGFLDRILVETAGGVDRDWKSLIQTQLPAAAVLEPVGVRTRENRKLLRSFRWNLRVLSYISLIVGAFLVYNTVSVSVVRRRPLIGVARAVGMTASTVRLGFLFEGLLFGVAGTAMGLALGKLLALGAVHLIGQTVQSLYLSSAPGDIEIRPWTMAAAMASGVGVAVASAWWPAKEAAGVPPSDAMAIGRVEYRAQTSRTRWALRGLACAAVSTALCFLPAWERVPYAAYVAAVGMVASATMLVPIASLAAIRSASRPLLHVFGVASMLGARTLTGSLARTAVIVAALATATAMMVSVAIMVGSMRHTLLTWIDGQLQADLYVQPERRPGEGSAPTMGASVANPIEALPSVEAVDRFRSYTISYSGLPATLALADFKVRRLQSSIEMLDGQSSAAVADQLISTESVIVSEPFSNKHGVHAGDVIRLPVGDGSQPFQIVGVYFDYSSERGFILGHREILKRYLPDPRLTGLGVYLKPGANLETTRSEVVRSLGGKALQVSRNRELRRNATIVFDRTFAITYALEAVAVFVAILGMAGALLTLVIDWRAELGVLRVLGGSKRQLRQLVLTQAGMLGLVSNLIGLVLGCCLSVILVKVINKQSFGWTIQFHWPVGFLLLAIMGIFAAALAAGLYPARIAAASDRTEVVHEL